MAAKNDVARLLHAAERYYEDGWKQSEIAREMGISRPLVSRLLTEARARGIVEITIHRPEEKRAAVKEAFRQHSAIRCLRMVEELGEEHAVSRRIAEEALDLLGEIGSRCIGIGWGHSIGDMVEAVEIHPRPGSAVEEVCPLVGNAGIPIRCYQSNENVRILADGLGAKPSFLYLPALAESMEEKDVLCATELYRQMERTWDGMDTALVNISNYPSTPDFASGARYGRLLQEQKACGRLLAYFYNEEGQIIQSDHDFAIEIPLDKLARCRRVIGLCSSATSLRALRGALATGLFSGLVVRESLAEAYAASFS